MINRAHIIQSQFIDIQFENMDNSNGLQNRLAGLFYEQLEPQMETLLDDRFGDDYYALVEQLEIDCGVIDEKNWEEELTRCVIQKLDEKLRHVNKKRIELGLVEEITAGELFFFFLKNGFMPWNKRINSVFEFEQHLKVNSAFLSALKLSIKENPKAAERLTHQFSEKFSSLVIDELLKDSRFTRENVLNRTNELNDKKILKAAIIKAVVFENEGEANLTEQTGSIILEEQSAIKTDNEETIYISNAGLILLHPFLTILFEQLKLTSDNEWIDNDAQLKAILILEYLVTGKDKHEEFDLVLNKLLCGLQPDDIVPMDLLLDESIKNECDNLLKEVIVHWCALKNTGIDALRETFLQHNGKLSQVDNGWLLTVEQKSTDILLGYLPWGFGVIKLPWMSDIIHTDWC